jgi:penicillin-binding protein 2
MTSDRSRQRLGLLAVTALSLFGALFARLWYLQVVEGDTLSLQVEANATQPVIIPAARGRILDRNGLVLVDNRQSIVVGIEAQGFEELTESQQEKLLVRLANALNVGKAPENQITPAQILARLGDTRYSRFQPIPVAEDITEATEIYFREQATRFPAVVVERTTVREYPYGSLAAHLLGYVGPLSDEQWARLEDDNDPDKPYVQTDEIGKAGVEASYEAYLRGTPGRQVFEVDRSGRAVREVTSERVEPRAGDDVYLALDARVQFKAEEALQAQLLNNFQGRPGAEAGSMVVLDHTSGEVRAMASYPTYNPADLVGGISCPTWRDLQGLSPEGRCGDAMTAEIRELKAEGQAPTPKLLNRAMQGAYPPASTFKLASAYAALQHELIDPAEYIQDGGTWRLCPGETTGCVKQNAGGRGWGDVNLQSALTVSSDVYFYRIGDFAWERRESIGDDALQQATAELGFGAKTGIDLPAESAGDLPTPASELEVAEALFEADPAAYDNDIEVAREAARWRGGLSADFAIGQKASVTPLQTANAYAALANGGKLQVPQVVWKVTAAGDPDEIRLQAKPELIRQLDFGATADDFINGFRGVVDPAFGVNGTAQGTFSGFPFSSMPLAGKTGTAQTGEDPETKLERPDNSLFVAFTVGGPTAWTASAMLEYSGFGGAAAAPAVRMVLEPIADGSIEGFELPDDGEIDAEAAAEANGGLAGGGSD